LEHFLGRQITLVLWASNENFKMSPEAVLEFCFFGGIQIGLWKNWEIGSGILTHGFV